MSYEKQTWVNGEVITADKLNHMENGIGEGGGGIEIISGEMAIDGGEYGFICTTTYEEVLAMFESGVIPFLEVHTNDANSSKEIAILFRYVPDQSVFVWNVNGFNKSVGVAPSGWMVV